MNPSTTGGRIELKVSGMTCGHCEQAVRKAIEGVAGVEAVEVSRERGAATVSGAAAPAALIAAIAEEGFEAELG